MASRLSGGLTVEVAGTMPSRPYIDLTLVTLRGFGVEIRERGNSFIVPPGPPAAASFYVEGDWSSASYPLAAGWLTQRPVHLTNMNDGSAQGDRVFPRLLESLRGTADRSLNLGDTPDLVPTVVACALYAQGATQITGAAHLRIKESDRIAVLVREFRRVGADIVETEDGLRVQPCPLQGGAMLDPCGDHRMAMAFGLASLRTPGIEVSDPGCVGKSYPGFWDMLALFKGPI